MNRRFTAAEYREFVASGEGKRTNKYRAKSAFRCEGCGGMCPDRKKRCPACGHDEIIRFDSRAEARRYDTLRQLEILGAIVGLRRQVAYPIRINDVVVGKWVADFVYSQWDGIEVVEDVKSPGTMTELYRFKRKCIEAMYGFRIQEVMNAGGKNG